MKTKDLSQTDAIGEIVAEQSAKNGTPKFFNTTLRESVRASEEAGATNERAAQLRAEGVRIQLAWDDLVTKYDQLTAAIAGAENVRSSLASTGAAGGTIFDELLRSLAFDGESSKSIHLAVECAKARIAIPVLDEAIKALSSQRLAKASEMKRFAKQHGVPTDALDGLEAA